ncbi:MAG TPA: heterodisulfide reductase-related iron-sulfur binding cluster [Vicinamibacterales bacterium]|nr:heterodisulfide reductase-related iron-sulfur binding cluster [Vicinamibacterales bacterium]
MKRDLLDDCVHCGFCLPTCPTYLLWGQETDSPRGRIHLMRQRRDSGESNARSFVEHIDTCLGCMACVTACPSGVQYDSLLEAARPEVERVADRTFADRAFRRAIFTMFPHPRRLRALAWPLGVYQKSGLQRLVHASGVMKLFPKRLQSMERLLPAISFAALGREMPERIAAEGAPRRRVALLLGCVQRVFFSEVNEATARVLAAEGCDVLVPREQGCCGALAEHAGEEADAIAAAKRLIDVFDRIDADTIVVNAAGCGSAMKRYGHLLRNDSEYAGRARAFSARCRDISEVLADLEPRARRGRIDARVAYHDACHLQHAQGVRVQPRQLLRGIPGIEVREITESEICCGSAGIYNLLEPDAADELRDRKVGNIMRTEADMIVSSNPGCLLQIAAGFEKVGRTVAVTHLVQLLDSSITAARAAGPAGAAEQ